VATYLSYQARPDWAGTAGSAQPRAAVEMSSADAQNLRTIRSADDWQPPAKLHERESRDL
jgi:lysozyme family protein